MNAASITATIAPGRRQLVNVRQQLLLTAKWRVMWVLILFAAITLGALLRIAGTYIINILKRLDGPQLARLEAALADLNHAAEEARRTRKA